MSGETASHVQGTPRFLHVVERNARVYKRIWGAVVSGAFEPAFYLFAVGVGVGALVGGITGSDGSVVRYAVFVTPGLLAASAMNGAVFESTFNLFGKLKYERTYDSMLATPMGPRDIAIGELVFAQLRGLLYGAGFLGIAMAFGLAPSPLGALLAIPAATLIGLAFGGVGMAATTFMRTWKDMDIITLVTTPMFLFSATFFPIDVYPEALQWVVRAMPLYHGVELVRACWFGVFDPTVIGHIAVLVVMAAAGLWVSSRRIAKLLLT